MPSPKKAVPISDVARPGKSEPSATSKSVLITNRPLMNDPMMSKVADESSTEKDTAPEASEGPTPEPVTAEPAAAPVATEKGNLQPVHQLVIKPPTDDERAARSAALGETIPEKPTPPVLQDVVAPPEKPTADPASPSTVTDDLSIPLNPDAEEVQAEDAEAERQAALDKLVESEKYFLPVDAVELRRAHQFIVYGLLLIIVLGFVLTDLALDAGLLHLNGITAPTNFFSN